MRARTKKEYIRAWEEHIDGLHGLCFCKDEILSNKVKKHITELKRLVIKIADTKKFKKEAGLI